MKISDIAKLAGVSKATVSRVINSPDKVSDKLRCKVEKVISETRYTPNLLAQELVTRKTKLIGVVLPGVGVDVFSKIADGITARLKEKDYNIILSTGDSKESSEVERIWLLKRKQVDGIIIFPHKSSKELEDNLENIDIPVVSIGRKVNSSKISTVRFKDMEAAEKATEIMMNRGMKKILFMGKNDVSDQMMNERYEGFMRAIDKNPKIEGSFTEVKGYDSENGYKAMEKLFGSKEWTVDGIFAATDRIAIGAMKFLNEKGFCIPEEISIMGFDDMEVSRYMIPSLSTIKLDYYNAGETAAELILGKIRNENIEDVFINYSIKERESLKEEK